MVPITLPDFILTSEVPSHATPYGKSLPGGIILKILDMLKSRESGPRGILAENNKIPFPYLSPGRSSGFFRPGVLSPEKPRRVSGAKIMSRINRPVERYGKPLDFT